MAVALPVEGVVDHHAPRGHKQAVIVEDELPGERLGIGVDQPGPAIKALPPLRVEGAVGLEVIQRARPEARHEHAPDVAPAIAGRIEVDRLRRRGVARRTVEQDPQTGGRAAIDHELHTAVAEDRPVGERLRELQRWQGFTGGGPFSGWWLPRRHLRMIPPGLATPPPAAMIPA